METSLTTRPAKGQFCLKKIVLETETSNPFKLAILEAQMS